MALHGVENSHALELFEQHLQAFLDQHAAREPIAQHVAYHFGLGDWRSPWRGKRLRPRLVMAAAASYGARAERTLPACAAIELLHNYSLIHDDIEDGDELRRGRQTLWTKFGLPQGINAGDAVGALAQLALEPIAQSHGAEIAFDMSADLARANLRMCEGQALDLTLESATHPTIDVYLEMIECKTAALFGCAASLGARCASADEAEVDRSRRVGHLFGVGFQIRDDVLGIWGDTAHTGKIAAGDLARRKKTFPVIWAMENDSTETGRALFEAYGKASEPSGADVERLRVMMEACGSYRAACSSADNYFESAWELAQGTQPLSDFVLRNRT